MSRFRALLKQHFDDNKINIVQFSQKCKIDRTTIQHMIGNRKQYRLPSLEVLDVVLKQLPMTPRERQNLKKLYMIEKIGVYHYEGRKRVKCIVEQIAWLHNQPQYQPAKKMDSMVKIHYAAGLYKGVNIVNSVIGAIFAEGRTSCAKDATMLLSVPFSYIYLKQMLLQACWESTNRFCVKHIVALSKNTFKHANPNSNLDINSDILPFSFCMGNQYQVKYYYTDFDPENELLLAMPFFIVTATNLVLLSHDFSSAILIQDPHVIQEYCNRFEQSFQQCQSLIEHIVDPIKIFKTYADCMTDGCESYAVEMHPCVIEYLPSEAIERTVQWDIPGVHEVIESYFAYSQKFVRMHTHNYFSEEGLAHFASTGILSIFSKHFVRPFSIPDRITILERMHQDIQNGGAARLLDASKMPISNRAIISTINNDSLQFYWCEGARYHICMINETSIVASFVDFFKSLPQNEFVFSAEETLAVLHNYITQLKNTI